MEVLDTSVANIALGHIGGALAASYDETSWILTSYLVANAVIVPVSGWLADRLGRKRYYMLSVALFTAASLACAMAGSLNWLILFRVLQGLGGGGLAACEQSMLIDSFPPSRRSRAISAYGLVLIVGPALGPSIGGAIVEAASWRWLFLINLPVGLISLLLVNWLVAEPDVLRRAQRAMTQRLDVAGFILIALGFGALQFVIDRGQISDWFASPMIAGLAVVAAGSLLCLSLWERRVRHPVLDVRLFAEASFAGACALMLVTGALLYGTTQIVPQYFQQVLGYTAGEAGWAMTASSMATVLATLVTALIAPHVRPWRLIAAGLVIETLGLAHMINISAGMDFWSAAWDRVWVVAGLPLILVPLTTGAYARLDATSTGHASAFLNLFRNIGGGIGIAAAQTILARRQPLHQARLAEGFSVLDPRWRLAKAAGSGMQGRLYQHGFGTAQRNLGLLVQTLRREALVLAYIDVFWVFAAVALVAITLTPLLAARRVRLPAAAS
jgi:DHA2 family multidrug resistance protein